MLCFLLAISIVSSACNDSTGSNREAAHQNNSDKQQKRDVAPNAGVAGGLFSKGRAPVVTGWENSPEKLYSGYCQDCHKDSHQQWSEGMHSQAWSSPIFQRAYEFESQQWCVNCHAPLQQTSLHSSEIQEWAREGINCAVCHVRGGKILGIRGRKSSGANSHEVVEAPYLKSSEFCAECHQFNFPHSFQNTVEYSTQPMQNTYSEWKSSGAPRCQSCHYKTHKLLGPHNKEWMRKQFSDYKVEFVDDELVSIQFKVAPRGHFTPTGDLFRSLVFVMAKDSKLTEILFEKRWGRFFGTGWTGSNQVSTHKMKKNSGIRPQEKRISLTVDAPPQGAIYAALIFYYHDPFFSGEGKGRDRESSLTLWMSKIRE